MEPKTFRRSRVFHVIHCCAFVGLLVPFHRFCNDHICYTAAAKDSSEEPLSVGYSALYLLRIVGAVTFLPWCVMTTLGLILFDAFETDVRTNVDPSTAPFLCFRIVTKGEYPDLVRKNVADLKELCSNVGLENFVIHVAANKYIGDLTEDRHVKQTVIPENYECANGARYKARSLQYCLENDAASLEDDDWIVHLDEETVATENSVRGILNFVADGRYQFGQGLLLLIHERVANWATSLMECWRVADDMGKLRFQTRVLHRLVVEWKGTFFVCKVGAEKAVSFDHGIEGSVTEDGFFGLLASQKGYKFQFIKGDMRDGSAGSVRDMVRQRKRWIQGGLEMARSGRIRFGTKWVFLIHFYGALFTMGGLVPGLLNFLFPLPFPCKVLDAAYNYLLFLILYAQSYGMVLSYLLYPNRGFLAFCLCLVGSWFFSFFNVLFGAIAVPLAVFDKTRGFYIIKKD